MYNGFLFQHEYSWSNGRNIQASRQLTMNIDGPRLRNVSVYAVTSVKVCNLCA